MEYLDAMDGSARGIWPLGLCGMLGLLGAAELGLRQLTPVLAYPALIEWRKTRQDAARSSQDCAWLCFGSSLVKYSVLPRVIERRAGIRGENLALAGGAPAAAYFLLRRALDHGAHPSAVVVEFAHARLADDPCDALTVPAWAQLLGEAEAIELGVRSGRGDFLGKLSVACLLPSMRLRHMIRPALLTAFQGQPVSQVIGGIAVGRNHRVNRGALVQPDVPGREDITIPPMIPDRSTHWKCHPVNDDFVTKFLDLAARRRITVYWLMPPIPPGMQTILDRSHEEAPTCTTTSSGSARYPNVTIIDGRFTPTFPRRH